MQLNANGGALSPELGRMLIVAVMRQEHSQDGPVVSDWLASPAQELAVTNLKYQVRVGPNLGQGAEIGKLPPLTFAGRPVIRDWNVADDVLIARNSDGVELGRITNLAIPAV